MSDFFDRHRPWTVSRTNPEYLHFLSSRFSISRVMAQILVGRGIRTPEQVSRFLEPDLADLHDPLDLPDMEVACDRIREAARRGESVLVVGDYDVDGLTSAALLTDVLERLGVSCRYVIPHRLTDGYGLKVSFLEKAADEGNTLVVTVDCGITAVEEARAAASLGLDLIITDHHQQTGVLPGALAVVDPHRNDARYPFTALAGVGVAYKMAEVLLGREASTGYLDLVALGTVADIVPLRDENRILVRAGLEVMRTSPRPGLAALCRAAGLDPSGLTSTRLSYVLAPRLNAAGRMGDAHPVVRLLKTEDPTEAEGLAGYLEEANRARQKLDAAVFAEARAMAESEGISDVMVLGSEGWHPGVLGIAAARLVGRLGRPVFLLAVQDGLAKGSGRSIPPFDLTSALETCSDILDGFGGHHQAAGIRLGTDRVQDLRMRLSEVFRARVKPEDLNPPLSIDAGVGAGELNLDLVRELESLEPTGFGNETPLLGCKGLAVASSRLVGRNHLKMRLSGGPNFLDAIFFDAGDKGFDALNGGEKLDVAFVPKVNEWEGRQSLQMHLKAIRPA